MNQITFLNVLFLLLGLLLNAGSWVEAQKRASKELRVDLSMVIRALTGIVASFIGLFYSQDIFETGGAVIPDDHIIYTAHAFICGLMPNIILDKILKVFSFVKR